jgi:sulfide:quinone oxidoreductase
MAHVVVLGAGLGGVIMAYEVREALERKHKVTVINKGDSYSFVPSNPWVAVGWRKKSEIDVLLTPHFERRGIDLKPQGATRVHPAESRVELADGTSVDYDYLVIATGPDLAFDEIPGFGPEGHTHSVCHVDHAVRAEAAFRELVKNPGPVVIGAVQGASCFGPAYEFAFILEKALRDARVRDRVPMTFITSEPYIGHLDLDGVGDTKGLLESNLRQRHIKWITNASVRQFEADKVIVDEYAEQGGVRQSHEVPFTYAMMLPAFRGVPAVRSIDGLVNPRGFVLIDKHQRNPTFPNIFGIGVGVAIPPMGKTPRRAKDRIHDREHGDSDDAQHRQPDHRQGGGCGGQLERGAPRRFWRRRRRLHRATADPAAQRQLVVVGPLGAPGEDRLQALFPAQDPHGEVGDGLREIRAPAHGYRQVAQSRDLAIEDR